MLSDCTIGFIGAGNMTDAATVPTIASGFGVNVRKYPAAFENSSRNSALVIPPAVRPFSLAITCNVPAEVGGIVMQHWVPAASPNTPT